MLERYIQPQFSSEYALEISRALLYVHRKRRTIRHFSQEVPEREILENAISIAATAPSGANKQPWSFALIQNPIAKAEIRKKAEKEELDFYKLKPNKQWLKDLEHLHTNEEKAFIEQAPYLIVIFYSHINRAEEGLEKHYYAKESAGIATGMLISALHLAGLATLTYTPKRMQFLSDFCNRSKEEKPFLLLAVGHPHPEAVVPKITKKNLSDILQTWD